MAHATQLLGTMPTLIAALERSPTRYAPTGGLLVLIGIAAGG